MLGDKRYGLTVNLLATKVMPTLIPAAVSPALKLDQVCSIKNSTSTVNTTIHVLYITVYYFSIENSVSVNNKDH